MSCLKKSFTSKKAAKSFVRRRRFFAGSQRAYKCPDCHRWHNTTSNNGMGKREEESHKIQTPMRGNPVRKSVSALQSWAVTWLRLNKIDELAREPVIVGCVVLVPEDEFMPAENRFINPIGGYYRVPIETEEDAIGFAHFEVFRG